MSNRLIAIGDIHGCLEPLEKLISEIAPTTEDTVVTLGDYVDRGPDSKGVVDLLIDLKDKCNLVAIQGNHEEMMLDVVKEKKPHFRWLQYGGVETLDSYGFVGDLDIIPDEHHQFFDAMVDYYETDGFLFLHANYAPELAPAEMDIPTIRWLKLTDVTPPPHVSGKRAIVGHTHDSAGEIFDLGYLACIDTYCYGGGWLTALEVHTGEMWQANMQGEFQYRPAVKSG
ncbi:MAG: metallophosphoesterase family protein [Planctomycetota bacterium]